MQYIDVEYILPHANAGLVLLKAISTIHKCPIDLTNDTDLTDDIDLDKSIHHTSC